MKETVQADKRGLRFFAIVGLFMFAGPPTGGLLIALLFFFHEIKMNPIQSSLWMIPSVTLMGYPFGLGPALAVGVIHAALAVIWQKNSVLVPLGSALVVTVICAALVSSNLFGASNVSFGNNLLGFGTPGLIASLVCWRLTRRFARMT